jgi:hypothetical protein
MESVFGTNFADVRVHVGHEAASIGALAFTIGSDLYFAPGQYNPQTMQGQQLLGHELTHVVQQRAGRVRNPLGAGVAVVQDPALEAEAERMGLRAASSAPPIQAKRAGTGVGVLPSPSPPVGPNTIAANGAILPARPPTGAAVQRKDAPITPGKSSASTGPVGRGSSLAYGKATVSSATIGRISEGVVNRKVAAAASAPGTGQFHPEPRRTSVRPTQRVIQMDYIGALKKEATHAVNKRLQRALYGKNVEQVNEGRWRYAQSNEARPDEKARLSEFNEKRQFGKDLFDTQHRVLSVWYESGNEHHRKLSKVDLERFLNEEFNNADHEIKLSLVRGAQNSYQKEAEKQFGRSGMNNQQSLILGYRQEVATEGIASTRILNTNIWSWGVNQAWVEGGAKASKVFDLGTAIGAESIALIQEHAGDGDGFLQSLTPEAWQERNPGIPNTLWHNRERRPTWYALEIASLLDWGYVLQENDGVNQLVPGNRLRSRVGPDVETHGVKAYLEFGEV